MKHTRYLLGGITSHHDVTRVRERLSDLAIEEGIGATNVERHESHSVLNIKHREGTVPDLGVLRAAVAAAGPYTLEPYPEEGEG